MNTKAKIKIELDSNCFIDWTIEKFEFAKKTILEKMHLDESDVDIKVTVAKRGKIFVEFLAVSRNPTVNALLVVEALERMFFDLKINKREVFYERK